MANIGQKQRKIIEALKQGAHLRMRDGEWSLYHADGRWEVADRERCMRLFERGYISAQGETEGRRWIYKLTRAGEQV